MHLKLYKIKNQDCLRCLNSGMKKEKPYIASRNRLQSVLALLPVVICLSLTGCLRELSPDDPCLPVAGDKAIRIVIHWDDVPLVQRPASMSTYWYVPDQYPYIGDYGTNGGYDRLPGALLTPLCLDYYGNSTLDFRNTGQRETYEVYNVPRTSLYNAYAEPVPGEPTVAEASPYAYYIDTEKQSVDIRDIPDGDTLTVHFYPKNVLREFTFLIYGVEGAGNMARNSGAVSGMSASFFPDSETLSDKPSTVLFTRVTPVRAGQAYPWSEEQKALFAAKNPDWQSPDPDKGWTGDWVTGKFSTFGPVDAANLKIRLTVEALTSGNRYYYGAWGYWYGMWEDMVGSQVLGAMGGLSGRGTPQEQLAWRNANGGFDIILFNDGRLVVPDDGGGGGDGGNGGFIVDSDDWGDFIHVK